MLGRLGSLAFALTLALAAPAFAGGTASLRTFQFEGRRLAEVTYTANPLQANHVDMTFDGSLLTIRDPGTMDSDNTCSFAYGWAVCVIGQAELVQVNVSLGENADTFQASLASDDGTFLHVDGGQGKDLIRGDTDPRGGLSTLIGGLDADRLAGGPGDEILHGGLGDDVMTGGGGTDEVSYDLEAEPYQTLLRARGTRVSLDGVANDGIAGIEKDNAGSGIENITGSYGSDVLVGDGAANRIAGGWGDAGTLGDDLTGGAGSDTIQTLRAADVVRSRDGEVDRLQCVPGVRADRDPFDDVLGLGCIDPL
jgi:Ca2+-binding RTX toxin-like protein